MMASGAGVLEFKNICGDRLSGILHDPPEISESLCGIKVPFFTPRQVFVNRTSSKTGTTPPLSFGRASSETWLQYLRDRGWKSSKLTKRSNDSCHLRNRILFQAPASVLHQQGQVIPGVSKISSAKHWRAIS